MIDTVIHPAYAAMAAHGISEAVEAIADDAMDSLDLGRRQHLDHLVRYSFRHVSSP